MCADDDEDVASQPGTTTEPGQAMSLSAPASSLRRTTAVRRGHLAALGGVIEVRNQQEAKVSDCFEELARTS